MHGVALLLPATLLVSRSISSCMSCDPDQVEGWLYSTLLTIGILDVEAAFKLSRNEAMTHWVVQTGGTLDPRLVRSGARFMGRVMVTDRALGTDRVVVSSCESHHQGKVRDAPGLRICLNGAETLNITLNRFLKASELHVWTMAELAVCLLRSVQVQHQGAPTVE